MTRKDYLDGVVDHQTYYSALADLIGRESLESIVTAIAKRSILAKRFAQDINLNNIPLAKWDGMDGAVRELVRRNGPGDHGSLMVGTAGPGDLLVSLRIGLCPQGRRAGHGGGPARWTCWRGSTGS